MKKAKAIERAPIGTPAVAERGEHEIVLAGLTYKLRPTRTAIRTIERKTGRSLRQLAALGNTGDLNLEQVGMIAGELIRAGAEDPMTRAVDDDRIEDLAYEEGLPHIIARLTLLMVDALLGGRTAEGEAKAPGTTI